MSKWLEKHYARKKLNEIQAAYKSNRITDWAKAADISLADPEFANLPIEEAGQIIQVRLADRLRRIEELLGEAK